MLMAPVEMRPEVLRCGWPVPGLVADPPDNAVYGAMRLDSSCWVLLTIGASSATFSFASFDLQQLAFELMRSGLACSGMHTWDSNVKKLHGPAYCTGMHEREGPAYGSCLLPVRCVQPRR